MHEEAARHVPHPDPEPWGRTWTLWGQGGPFSQIWPLALESDQ